MRRVIGFALFVLIAMAIPAAAQTDSRLKVSEAVAKGDTAGAEKLVQELTASKSAASIVVYEELRACGFYPQETRLACVIDIKQPFGYGGPIARSARSNTYRSSSTFRATDSRPAITSARGSCT